MRVTTDVDANSVDSAALLTEALRKATRHRRRTIFVLDHQGLLVGSISSGDVYTALAESDGNMAGISVTEVMQRSVVSAPSTAPVHLLQRLLNPPVDALPLVDARGRMVAVAIARTPPFYFGDRLVGDSAPCLVVAEIGNNHNGDPDVAWRMAHSAIESGADAVKFQMRHLHGRDTSPKDLGSEYTGKLLREVNLEPEVLMSVMERLLAEGIPTFCTPWDPESAALLARLELPAVKIASADLTNHSLIRSAASWGKPLIVSTGMSTEHEIIELIRFLDELDVPYALLHAVSAYPAAASDINLRYMDRLAELGQVPVGYSSHDLGWEICVAAVARGAKIVEKHFTWDRDARGNDHRVSLLPDELTEMVQSIRRVESAMGNGSSRELNQGEVLNRESLAKSLVFRRSGGKGERIAAGDLGVQTGGLGLSPSVESDVVGRNLVRDVQEGKLVSWGDFFDEDWPSLPIQLDGLWGIPVRFHDVQELNALFLPELLEFHLSHEDMERYSRNPWRGDGVRCDHVVVHAPELLGGDHVVDLVAEDAAYRRRSFDGLLEVAEITIGVSRTLGATSVPKVVVNPGGWSREGFFESAVKVAKLERLREAAFDLVSARPDVHWLFQTMPPFPWHFGGQRFHNLLVDPGDVGALVGTGVGICLDLSHSYLAAEHLGLDIAEFFRVGGRDIGHVHVADARPPAGEGLQIGEGDIDFPAIKGLLVAQAPDASFIIEIWQGHKECGLGFAVALDRLRAKGW